MPAPTRPVTMLAGSGDAVGGVVGGGWPVGSGGGGGGGGGGGKKAIALALAGVASGSAPAVNKAAHINKVFALLQGPMTLLSVPTN